MLAKNVLGKTRLELTQFGIGATGIAGMYTEVHRLQAMEALELAWTKGVRYFDVAPFYGFGLGERRMGDFLRAQTLRRANLCGKILVYLWFST